MKLQLIQVSRGSLDKLIPKTENLKEAYTILVYMTYKKLNKKH